MSRLASLFVLLGTAFDPEESKSPVVRVCFDYAGMTTEFGTSHGSAKKCLAEVLGAEIDDVEEGRL